VDQPDDPFPAVVTPCYSFGPGRTGIPGGGHGTVRIDRLPTLDIDVLPEDPSPPDVWQERSACYGIDPDVFFPISEEEAGPALAFCSACTIREECLSWALKNGERYGVWGGLTEQQRRRLARQVA
jgi:WhiB family transcriptional regulator, redox-sensing transcriptional regulator